MRLFRAIFFAAIALSSLVRAEPPNRTPRATPPQQLSRVLRNFDFEERDHGNVEDVPAGWVQVEGPGLPHYLHGVFDSSSFATGRASFRMDLNGGSITYRFPAGQIPVMTNAAYRASVMCRTTPLRAARARLTAYLCDIDGRPLAATVRSSDSFVSETGDDKFRPLSVDIAADDPRASSLVLEMSLLQSSRLADSSLGEQKLLVEDIHGSAWFDDLRIAQVPTVTLATDQATNVFDPGEKITLRVRVLDRIATDLTGELRVFDVDGRLVHQRTGAIEFGRSDGDALVGAASVPELPAGWYEARLAIRSRDQLLAERSLKFACLGAARSAVPADPRFGVDAVKLAPGAWDILPDAMSIAAAGRAKVAAWSADHGIDSDAGAAFDRLLDALRPDGRTVTACLVALPPEVRKLLGGDHWTDLLRAPRDGWQPQLSFLLARYATHLDRWQLMPDEDAEACANEPARRAAFAKVFEEFERLTGSTRLAMPWPAWFEVGESSSSIALSIPPEILPEQLPLYLRDASSGTAKVSSLTLQPIDVARYGRLARERDLALRIAYALSAGADRIDLPLPFTTATQHDGSATAEPTPLLLVQRTVQATLSNARYAGKVTIAPGVDAFLFDRGGRAGETGSGVMLVSTPSTAPLAPAGRVSIALGKRATRVDLDGTVSAVARSTDRRRPDEFELQIGERPFFVVDIDAPLMLLRAGIQIDNPMLESSVVPLSREIAFTNTFDSPISGSIRVAGPAGWTVSLPGGAFSLSPGETFRGTVNLSFPMNASSGDKVLTADLKIDGRANYRLNVPIGVKLGLSDVGLRTIAVRSGDEVIVQQVITNYGSKPINYNAFVTIAGLPRQERIISALGPGKAAIRKYRLPLSHSSPVGKLRSGVREVEGKRMLNDEVEIR
jgi:hypothetical protein